MFKNRLLVGSAFSSVFNTTTVWNKAYFFVIVPFTLSLGLFVLDVFQVGELVRLIFGLVVIVVNVLYQLYLWSTSFFYSQAISDGDWNDYYLTLSEMTKDYAIKFRLLLLRIFWYAPVALLTILIIVVWAQTNDLNLVIDNILVNLIVFSIFFVFWQQLVDHTVLNVSEFLYSESNSLLVALNPIKVLKFLFGNLLAYLKVLGIALTGTLFFAVAIIPLSLLFAIPLIGGLVLGFFLGLQTMFNVLFMANLKGQVWAQMKPMISK